MAHQLMKWLKKWVSPVFKRIWKAVQYVFGHRSNYGDFDEFIFKPEDAGSLQQVVDYMKNNIKTE